MQFIIKMSTLLLTKKTVAHLGTKTNDAQGSKVSDFAKKQMEKMGWKEGEGLGKDSTGMTTHIKVAKKDESTGLGLEKNKADSEAKADGWWHEAFSQNLKQFKIKGIKKSKKRKADDSNAKESSDPPTYEELFKATGGARLGMRARASQKGKHLRTEDAI